MLSSASSVYVGGGGNVTTTSLRVTQPPCRVCRKVIEQTASFYGFVLAHDECQKCPKCDSTFVVWQGPDEGNNKGRARLRCQACLHGWRGKKESTEISVHASPKTGEK